MSKGDDFIIGSHANQDLANQSYINNSSEKMVSMLSVMVVFIIIGMISLLINNANLIPVFKSRADTQAVITAKQKNDKQLHEIQIRFDQGVALLHAKQYEFAVQALDKVIALSPGLPEAYVNMGFALLGLKQYESAGNAFNKATELKVEQANAYWGLALALEGLEDYEAALGAMRSFIHLTTPNDPFLAKARSALWEWEARLGRISGVTVMPDGTLSQVQPAPRALPPGTNSVLKKAQPHASLNKELNKKLNKKLNKPSADEAPAKESKAKNQQ